MRRLIRESNPPSGQLASPVPQYWNPSTEAFEDVLGEHGAPRAILYGPNGQPIGTQTNPLDVRVRELEAKLDELKQTIESGVQLKGSNVEILAEYQGYTGHNTQNLSVRYFGATVGPLTSARPLDVRRFGGLVLKLTNGYNVAVTHRIVAFKVGEPGAPIWVDVTEDADLPAGAEFVYELPNRYPYIALRVVALARDPEGETGLDVDIVGSVFYA